MRIAIVSDAWFPQINGVVRTLKRVCDELGAEGHEILVVHPGLFRTLPCPTYPEIRLAILPGARLRGLLEDFAPEAIHVATEGPLGLSARGYCLKRNLPFTTSYHTRFPEYVAARFPLKLSWLYAFMRRFHNSGAGTMVATESLRRELAARGFQKIKVWSRGVDTKIFQPLAPPDLSLEHPVFINVGRVAVEKNLEAFLSLKLPGSKVIVGGGPQLEELKQRYPEVHFLGPKEGEDLVRHYALGDVFVFPSRTDTFGLVLLEALACGLPVAAYPVPGPLDVIGNSGVGRLDEDLESACKAALEIPRDRCRPYAERFSWHACAQQFLNNLEPEVLG